MLRPRSKPRPRRGTADSNTGNQTWQIGAPIIAPNIASRVVRPKSYAPIMTGSNPVRAISCVPRSFGTVGEPEAFRSLLCCRMSPSAIRTNEVIIFPTSELIPDAAVRPIRRCRVRSHVFFCRIVKSNPLLLPPLKKGVSKMSVRGFVGAPMFGRGNMADTRGSAPLCVKVHGIPL